MAISPPTTGDPSRLRPWLELLRLPNVFTAVADVLAGFLFFHDTLEPWDICALVVCSSVMLYLSGMVLNDVMDREVDARQRPERPIPSGRISLAAASRLGWSLLIGGVAAAWLASGLVGQLRPGIVATLLAGSIVAYDMVLKKTLAGPIVMGGCRLLNVLLGMSAATQPWTTAAWMFAGGVGVYVAGVTMFARTEAARSRRAPLALGAVLMLAGIALVAAFPRWIDDWDLPYLDFADRWPIFWIVISMLIGLRLARAIADPEPANVQTAVKNAILSIIVIDAGACLAMRGPFWATMVVLLMVPALALGRWIYST